MAGQGRLTHAIFRVARLHKMFAGYLLRETGLHAGQELLMVRLWDEGPQHQVDLVQSLVSDAPTIATCGGIAGDPAAVAAVDVAGA